MHESVRDAGTGGELLRIEDCLDARGGIVLPPGVTLISLIDRNIAHVGDTVAYRYLDFSGPGGRRVIEITWAELGVRMRAIGAHVQRTADRGDRVAILAPQGLEYVAAFYGSVRAGAVAVPLFAPEFPGHAERLTVALRDAQPSLILTTTAVRAAVQSFLTDMGLDRIAVTAVDEIADADADDFAPVHLDVDDVSHLQYTGGATRPPVGVQITHRAVGTNLIQMILSIDLLDRNTHGMSWLPLYHDMGLSMIGFPAVYGGHSTLMSPTAFLRRPSRWIEALSEGSKTGRVVTAAPNFAYEWAAQRGVPTDDADVDLRHVVMIIGSEPVSIEAIDAFNAAFAPFNLPPNAIKPSYGLAEATLFVSTIGPLEHASAVHLDRHRLALGRAVPVDRDHPNAVTHVSCGRVARSLWCVIVDPDEARELADGQVGEIWLQGDNIGHGYWGLPEESRHTFGARLAATIEDGSHAEGAAGDRTWLRTGDLGFYLDGELYVTGRTADQVIVGGHSHYPQDIEAAVAAASPVVRRGYVVAFAADDDVDGDLVIIATCGGNRAAGSSGCGRRHQGACHAATWSDGVRCPGSARRGNPAHHQRQAGAGGVSSRLSPRSIRLSGQAVGSAPATVNINTSPGSRLVI